MRTIETAAELRQQVTAARGRGERVGAVFAGSLTPQVLHHTVRHARAQCDLLVLLPVSHYVGPAPRFARSPLPRFTLRERAIATELASGLAVDLVWRPGAHELRIPGSTAVICEPPHDAPPSVPFDRASAEATLLAKFAGVACPDVVYVDSQDAIRLAMIQRAHADLFWPFDLRAVPEVRDEHGVLIPPQRGAEPLPELRAIPQALDAAEQAAHTGERSIGRLRARIEVGLAAQPALRTRYVEIVDAGTLSAIDRLDRPALAVVAVDIASAHALDHRLLTPVGAAALREDAVSPA